MGYAVYRLYVDYRKHYRYTIILSSIVVRSSDRKTIKIYLRE